MKRTAEAQMERHRRLIERSRSGDIDDSAADTFPGERDGCARGEIQGTYVGGQEEDRAHLRNQVPIAQDNYFIRGDMSPVDKIMRILDEDATAGTNLYGKAVALFGAFHYRMNALDSANESNRDAAEWLVSPCYGQDGESPTEKNLSYFFNFGDPAIPETQVNAILVAIYTYVIRCMRKEEQTGVSPVSAYEWMKSRAIESPKAMNLLRLIHDWMLVLMQRYAERNNNFDMHLATKRLSLPLFTVTHSVSYVRNTFDFLRDWEVRWSDRTKQIIRDQCFTIQSETGVNIACDLGHEKAVRLEREYTGKQFRRGHQLKIEQGSVMGIHQATQGKRHAMCDLSGKGPAITPRPDWTKDARSVRAFVQALLLLEDSKIFEQGLSEGETDDSVLISCTTGDPLDGTLLKLPAVSDECIKHYGTRYYIDSQHEVIRHDKDMGLISVRGTSENIKSDIDRLVKRSTSIVNAEVGDSGTKAEIYKEFEKLEPYLSREQKKKVPQLTSNQLNSYAKKTLVKILVTLRKQAFLRRPEAKVNLEKAARESEQGLGTSQARRRETLEHIHFSGNGCVAMQNIKFNELREL